jgi:cytochrome c553
MRWIITFFNPTVRVVHTLAAGFALSAWNVRALQPGEPFAAVIPLLETYCTACHGEDKQKGEVDFSQFADDTSLYRNLHLWDRVIEQLSAKEMPPKDKKQPSDAERAELVAWMEHFRDHLDFTKIPRHPGRPTLRRLNRDEFSRTLRDLLRINYNAGADLPLEGSGGGGFDNNGDTLFAPPLLMEKLVSAVHAAVDRSFQDLRKVGEVRPHTPKEGVSSEQTAQENLRFFVPKAFRRPVKDEEIEQFLDVFRKQHAEKPEFEAALAAAYRAVLLSPRFLFRVEQDRPHEKEWRISAHELATRLSFFIWSTQPDAKLRELADNGKLLEDTVLEAEVKRLLEDPRAEALPRAFMGQWLGMKELETTKAPDPVRFPEFTPALRDAMLEEPVRYLEHLLKGNRPLTELIDSDYAFTNERLAQHYGIPPPKADHHGKDEVQRTPVTDRRRGGILGMGAVHVATSYPLRTSPVLRGKWVQETLVGTRIPPPPPGTGNLPADEQSLKDKTLREQLALHVSKPECAGCHSRIDPPGFAMENFDSIGRWRTESNGRPVDASGELVGGVKFGGLDQFKDILMQRKDAVMRHLVEKMLSYALGRGLEYTDQPSVQAINEKLKSQGWPARGLILEIVRSYPFQFRGSP